jgi:hypothetical protein
MPDNKKSEFTVTDRRRFSSEGESNASENERASEDSSRSTEVSPVTPIAGPEPPPTTSAASDQDVPPPPSAEERQAQHDAFNASAKQLDDALAGKLGEGRSAKDFEVSFERFVASLYMSALVQLGLVHEQGGQPQVDLIGGRQTIDTLGMIATKTKGNLDTREENLLQNCLYELRMAYVDVTNMLTKPPEPGKGPGGPGGPILFPGKK